MTTPDLTAKLRPRLADEDRALLVAVLRWGRANGWRHFGYWAEPWWSLKGVYRVFADRDDDDVLHLRIDDKTAGQGLVGYWPRSVVEAVDLLAALGIVPGTFSSIHRGALTDLRECAADPAVRAHVAATVPVFDRGQEDRQVGAALTAFLDKAGVDHA